MAYSSQTPHYGIPYLSSGEKISSETEKIKAEILENLIRAGILGAGGNRAFREGTYEASVNSQNLTTVKLTGNPALQGICNEGLVESYDPIVWSGLVADTVYWLYVLAGTQTLQDPADFGAIASTVEITTENHLLLAQIDTTGATTTNVPTIDTNPSGKPTGFNLFELLNTHADPFGPLLTQTALTILDQLTVYLGSDKTLLIKQVSSTATAPTLSFENSSDQPEIHSSGELRLSDQRVLDGLALSDSANPAYIGAAVSLIGALNEILRGLLAHLADSDDPHGETLTQTQLILRNYLRLPKLILTCPVSPPGPPSPPGSPPTPPTAECNILSECEMVFCDNDDAGAHITLSDYANRDYLGTAASLIGALNELYQICQELQDSIGNILNTTVLAKSPINLLISPDEVGASLHFKIELSEQDNLSEMVATIESKEDPTGWYYEYHPPLPASPPPPPRSPHTTFSTLSDVTPLPPEWRSLPIVGLSESLQTKRDGTPVLVQYRPKDSDGIYARRRYAVLAYQYNLEYGEPQLGSLVLG